MYIGIAAGLLALCLCPWILAIILTMCDSGCCTAAGNINRAAHAAAAAEAAAAADCEKGNVQRNGNEVEAAEAEFRRQERERLDKAIRARKERETAKEAKVSSNPTKVSAPHQECEVTTITEVYNPDGSLTTREETVKPDGSKTIKIMTKPVVVTAQAMPVPTAPPKRTAMDP